MLRRLLVSSLCLVLLSACDDDRTTVDAGPRLDAGPTSDAGPTPDGGPTSDAGPGLDAGPIPDSGGATGAMQGTVTRTGTPAAGGVGNLYIAIFTSDPVIDREGAVNVANVLVENADMSSDSASIPYTMTGIPPRAEPYFVTAFLDDNMTVTDPTMAAPDRGDLVALDGLSSLQVTVPDTTPVRLDLVLNFNLPF